MRALAAPVFVPYGGAPLVEGTLLDRRDRFIASIRLQASGQVVEAHCVNPGRMEAFVAVGARVWLQEAPAESSRKLRYTWEAIEIPHASTGSPILASCNTVRPNTLARDVLQARCLPGLADFESLTAEHTFTVDSTDGSGKHKMRVDFLLTSRGGADKHYVEVKNCHLVLSDGCGYFPDSVCLGSVDSVG